MSLSQFPWWFEISGGFVFVAVALLKVQIFVSYHRHFLFKHGSGSSAIFSATSQNYPLTSNTVYSPPPRPLPRSTFSRPAFTFNKPYRCCNWKCTALSATAITVTLALLLAYVIGKPFFPCLTFLLNCVGRGGSLSTLGPTNLNLGLVL